MKSLLLLSVATATLLQMSVASAQDVIPSIYVSPQECHGWAQAQGNPTKGHAHERCQAIQNCMENQSDNRNDLDECLFAAESQFQRATSSNLPLSGPSAGDETSAVTEVPDSTYFNPERDKGFDFSKQGS